MKNLSKEVRELVTENPDDFFRVLIVMNAGSDLRIFKDDKYSVLMENIVSGQLQGTRILQLAANPDILSIELDQEMKIL